MTDYARNDTHSQILHLENRKTLTVGGTKDVISFDENNVTLRTVNGDLFIDGSELRIVSLNADEQKGNILIEGNIAGLFFDDDPDRRHGLFGRRRS